MTNDLLRIRREGTPSPSGSGAPMSRSELAGAVNEYIRAKTGRASGLRREEVWRWERGKVRWPGKQYREALRAVLGAGSDEELGFVPATRSQTTLRTGASVSARTNGQKPYRGQDTIDTGIERYGSGLTVRALIRRGGHLLVVRREGAQWSSLPGGRVRAGTPVQSSLLGYVARQTGLEATIVGFAGGVEHHGIEDDDVQHAITLVFEAQVTPGAPGQGLDAQWLAVEDLACHDVRPAGLKEALIDGADGPFWRAWTL